MFVSRPEESWVHYTMNVTPAISTYQLQFCYISLWFVLTQSMCVIFGPPHTTRDNIQALESVQKFALRVITKLWAHSYEELLSLTALPTLEKRRLFLRLQFLYKIVNDLCFFPHGLVTFRDTTRHNLCSSHSLSLAQPFARTNRTLFSFIPNTISAWNSLPLDVVSAPDISSFKKRLSLQLFQYLHIICTTPTIGYTLYQCIYLYVTISVPMHSKIIIEKKTATTRLLYDKKVREREDSTHHKQARTLQWVT